MSLDPLSADALASLDSETLQAALIVGGKGTGAEELLQVFVDGLKAQGVNVGGVYQRTELQNVQRAMILTDILEGEDIKISQELGKGSNSCILDPDGLATGAVAMRKARESDIDLLVANKFSSREADGGGLIEEMFLALSDGLLLLTTVAPERQEAWVELSGGIGVFLEPNQEALEAWWAKVKPD